MPYLDVSIPLRACLIVAMALPLSGLSQTARGEKPLVAYVGTFSSPLQDVLPTQVDLPPGNGRGIHLFHVDRASGQLTAQGTFDLGTSPSCLAVNATATRLYSANETDRVAAPPRGQHSAADADQPEGSVSSFAIDPDDGSLRMLNTVASGGAGPTYVAIHPSGKWLLVANYFGGSVAVLPILDDGSLGAAADVQIDDGPIGPTVATNAPLGSYAFSGHDRTHAHQILADASGRHVLHVDLGMDRIFVWDFDNETGRLTPARQPSVSLPPGDGPRHFHFHPDGRWFYSIQEEGSTVALFDYDPLDGTLSHRQTVSSLPPGYQGSNFCSEILVSPDGRFVYAGNRLHDGISIFAIGADGTLTYQGDVWTRGNYPRSFSFDPTGRYLYCCNQRADHVTVFAVDPATGGLTFTGQYAAVGNPSMVAFADLESN